MKNKKEQFLPTEIQNSEKSVISYRSEDGTIQLDVQLVDDNVWLTQAQMTELFQKDRTTITRHINNAFKENEVDEKSNVRFLHIAFSDKPVKFYSLDVIIAVGYRVKSKRGTDFRKWALPVIKDYMLRGYAVNNRLDRLEVKVYKLEEKTSEIETEIILIDNYIDDTVFTMLNKRNENVSATIYTSNISKNLKLDLAKHNSQYPPINIELFTKSHDRFLIIDDDVYHVGASLKDLGKRLFVFSKLHFRKEELLKII